MTIKPTKANLLHMAASLDDTAEALLKTWILVGEADKYNAMKAEARKLREAVRLPYHDRVEFLG